MNKRSRFDDKLIAALVAGGTVVAAAQQAGCTERNVYFRLANPEFRRRLQEARAAIFQAAVDALTSEARKAVAVLADLKETASKDAVKLAAANAIVRNALTAHANMTAESVLAELRCRVEEFERDEPITRHDGSAAVDTADGSTPAGEDAGQPNTEIA
jgi:hypothetical protein